MAIERDEEEDIEPTDGEWVYVCNQRPHTHDVRTLVCGNVYRKPIRNKKGIEINHGFMECLLSGGVDTQISWSNLKSFEKKGSRMFNSGGKVLSMPPTSNFSISKTKRLLMVQHDTNLKLWKLGSTIQHNTKDAPSSTSLQPSVASSTAASSSGRLDLKQGHVLELDMDLSTTSDGRHIVSSDLSQDGTYVVTAFTTRVTLYRIHEHQTTTNNFKTSKNDDGASTPSITTTLSASGFTMIDHAEDEAIQEALQVFRRGAHIVKFFPNTNTLIVSSMKKTTLIDPKTGKKKMKPEISILELPPVNVPQRYPKLIQVLKVSEENPIDATPYHDIVISPDGAYVACGTEQGTIRLFDLKTGNVCTSLPILQNVHVSIQAKERHANGAL